MAIRDVPSEQTETFPARWLVPNWRLAIGWTTADDGWGAEEQKSRAEPAFTLF